MTFMLQGEGEGKIVTVPMLLDLVLRIYIYICSPMGDSPSLLL
jgi:hypothetical protein